MLSQICPHCGVGLPPVSDAFCPSCREPIDVSPVANPCTLPSQEVLKALLASRYSSHTVSGVIRKSISKYMVFAMIIGSLTGLCFYVKMEWAVGFVLGLFVGLLMRDIGYIQMLVHTWPMNATILDWEKIERLAGVKSEADMSLK
jgi:hypothetical protein